MKRFGFVLLAGALVLSACEFSLAGDITPPPATLTPAQGSTAPVVQYPGATPDIERGAAIFAQDCSACHGVSGLGDGPQAAELPFPPAPIGDDEFAGLHSPEEWFQVLSAGRLERFMPPFSGLLDVQQRWDTLAYVFSLGLDPEFIDVGEQLYVDHRDEIQRVLPEEDNYLDLSLQDIISIVEPSVPSLSSAQLIALASYIQARSLGFAGAEQGAPVEEPSTGETDTETFTGQVIDGTDGELPGDLSATLSAYDHDQLVFTATISVDASGRFAFANVPLAPGRFYFVQVDYLGLRYFSEFITVEENGTEFAEPITIYETTSDTSQLAVETLQLVFEFHEPGLVRVVERVQITNLGDRAVVPSADGDPVLRFSLPAAASALVFEEGALGERYFALEDGFGDLRSVLPGVGSYQMLFAYELPYRGGLKMQIPIDLPTRTILVFAPAGQVEISGTYFQSAGEQEINGINYGAYLAQGGFSPGDEVEISLRGTHPLGTGGLAALASDDRLLVGLAALTVAVGSLYFWLRRLPREAPRSSEQILDEITALDERYEDGMIKQAAYDKRRAALKARLRRSLEKNK